MRERISTPGKVRIGFVGTHPSLEKSEGWHPQIVGRSRVGHSPGDSTAVPVKDDARSGISNGIKLINGSEIGLVG
jgi:hypothetical protein